MNVVRTAKEIARHFMYSAGIQRRKPYLAGESRTDRFSNIYREGVWTLGQEDIPLSGAGSSLQATEALCSALPDLICRLQVRTLIDVGCGDFTWMSQVDLGCDYVGLDIVPWLTERNTLAFGSPQRRFLTADLVTEPAPKGDLVLCREVLFHLSLEDGIAALRNMLASGCAHLLLTSDRVTGFNAQIDSGDFRIINLQRPPYRFPEPIEKIDDDALSKGRFMGVWRAEDVSDALDRVASR